ncbi:MAG: hypothetical protein NC489_18145 [Ruminococcus flavefaciens]|nr:hypothetical protein [Ruminococcus flavefaciens]
MYYIMNKDREVMSFEFVKNKFGLYEPVAVNEQLPDIFRNINLKQWLEMRRPAKHRTEIQKLLKSFGMLTLKGFIDVTYGLTLTDTFWVRPAETDVMWSDVSLYTNKFNDIIANSAFLGSIPEFRLKTTSPEYGTDGMLPKCWIRRDDNVYLLKGGIKGFWDSINEPYSEYFASQLADTLGLNHIHYDIELYHNRTVSSCRLLTSEKVSMFPSVFLFSECSDISDYVEIVDSIGFGEKFREMLLFDAIIFNYDRHLGNMQFLYDSDTLEVLDIAPIFDNGAGLASRCKANDFDSIYNYCHSKVPFAYDSFDDMLEFLISDSLYSRLQSIRDFEFVPSPDIPYDSQRLDSLNRLIQIRIDEIIRLTKL